MKTAIYLTFLLATAAQISVGAPPSGGSTVDPQPRNSLSRGAEGFFEIFDGATLNGWKAPDMSYWSVEEGAITGRISKEHPCTVNQYLVWQGGELADFELTLKSRVNGEGGINNGFQFRSRLLPDGDIAGYQVDNNLQTDWLVRLYDEFGRHTLAWRGQRTVFDENGQATHTPIPEAAGPAGFRLEEWQEYHLLCEGSHLRLEVNDRLMAEVFDRDARRSDAQGVLGLQLHSGPATIAQFKDIRLKILNPAAPPQSSQAKAADRERETILQNASAAWDLGVGGHGAQVALKQVGDLEFNARAAGPAADKGSRVAILRSASFEAAQPTAQLADHITVYLRARDPEGRWNMGLLTGKGAQASFNLYSVRGNIGFEVRAGTGSETAGVSFPVSAVDPRAWHDLAGRYDGQAVELICDGQVMAKRPWKGGKLKSSSAPLVLGAEVDRDQLVHPFSGEMETAAVWPRALQDEQLAKVMRIDSLKPSTTDVTAEDERRISVLRFARACADQGLPSSNVLVGFATSMEKTLPRKAPFEIHPSKQIELSVARNEKESLQLAVMPVGAALRKVAVSVGELKTTNGAVFAHEHIQCDVVGYVETRKAPPYPVSHVGWWPDPILDFLGPVDIAVDDLQCFWIRVRAPKDQPAGVYHGTLSLTAEGLAPMTFDLKVRVYGFALPDHSPLPLAITFFEQFAQMGGEENWSKHKFEYADFLADYGINYDSLYRAGPPDFEIIQHLHEQGRLVTFNLGNVFNDGAPTNGFEAAISNTVARINVAYTKAKALGLLNHAYIYGFDERGKDQFPLLEQCAQRLREAFPEVELITTSYDASFGQDSVVKTIDAWCPLTPSYNQKQAERARAAERRVWWYICCGPHHPHANMFVEYPAIEGRLLMGPMTAKERPDGFLYYSLSIWNQNKPIESGPFTSWNPVSWTTYHGDGSWFCSGPGGKPVPTIRLENFRDGLEDYAYACILKEIVRQREASAYGASAQDREWLAQAKSALPVPESLVKTVADYSRDPARLYAWRNRIGDLIDRSGIQDANPWGKDFAVRGFRSVNSQ